MKFLITENQFKSANFKYLDYLFEGMYEIESKKYPDSRFWKKDDNVVLELRNSGYLLVLYSIWENISNMFSLEYDETQQLIKDWVKKRLKLEIITPVLVQAKKKLYVE
jgi:hypothetical protein